MKLLISILGNIFLIVILFEQTIFINAEETTINDDCTLTKSPSSDPFPSLSKCYKYNNEACCKSVHDDYINEYIGKILSPSCIRKYTEFENLMCFGCHPLERNYVDKETKVIRICPSFAYRLWTQDEKENDKEVLDKPTKVFDNCGFKVELKDLRDLVNETTKTYIIPSIVFPNFTFFFQHIKIPFYEDYTVNVTEKDDQFCYNHSSNMNKFLLLNLFLLLYFIL